MSSITSAEEVQRITGVSADAVTRYRTNGWRQLTAKMRGKLAAYLRKVGRYPELATAAQGAIDASGTVVSADYARGLLDAALIHNETVAVLVLRVRDGLATGAPTSATTAKDVVRKLVDDADKRAKSAQPPGRRTG